MRTGVRWAGGAPKGSGCRCRWGQRRGFWRGTHRRAGRRLAWARRTGVRRLDSAGAARAHQPCPLCDLGRPRTRAFDERSQIPRILRPEPCRKSRARTRSRARSKRCPLRQRQTLDPARQHASSVRRGVGRRRRRVHLGRTRSAKSRARSKRYPFTRRRRSFGRCQENGRARIRRSSLGSFC